MSSLRNLADWFFPTLRSLPYDYHTSRRKLWHDKLDCEERSVSNEADACQWAEDKATQLEDEKERNTSAKERAKATQTRSFVVLSTVSTGLIAGLLTVVTKSGDVPNLITNAGFLGTACLAGGIFTLLYMTTNAVQGFRAASKALQLRIYLPDPGADAALEPFARWKNLARRRTEATLERSFQTDDIFSQCKLAERALGNVVAGFALLIFTAVSIISLLYFLNMPHIRSLEDFQGESNEKMLGPSAVPRSKTAHENVKEVP